MLLRRAASGAVATRQGPSAPALPTSAACCCSTSGNSNSWTGSFRGLNEFGSGVACRSRGGAKRLTIVCMAQPRRVAKVASAIQREIGDMLVNDSVVQNALSPERRLGEDMQLSVVPSITHVYVSNDLQVVKVYISIYSDDYGKKRAMTNLKKLEPYVRREMGSRVPLRLTPEYRFEYDDTLDEMELVQKVIGEEDVARYKRELAEEYGEDELEEAATGAAARGAPASAGKGNDDDAGFFDDVGEQEYRELSSSDVFDRPGPFDDLFTGDGDLLVQARGAAMPQEAAGAGRRGGGGGRGKGRRGGGKAGRGAR